MAEFRFDARAAAWFFVAEEFGLPLAGTEKILVRSFMTHVAIRRLGVAVVKQAIERLRSDGEIAAISNVDDHLEVGDTFSCEVAPPIDCSGVNPGRPSYLAAC